MIVVFDTTPLISLLKIDRLEILEKLFGEVILPKGRNVSKQMEHRIMGTIGILMAAYEENELTAEEVKECIEGLKLAGRHIGQKYYRLLLEKLKEEN